MLSLLQIYFLRSLITRRFEWFGWTLELWGVKIWIILAAIIWFETALTLISISVFLISIKGLLPCLRFSYLLSFILNVNLILHKDHSFYLDNSAAFNYSLLIFFFLIFNQTLHLNFKRCTKIFWLPAVNLEATNRFRMYLA